MKVGRMTILMAAFLLMLPIAAFAGADPCAGLGGDGDGDGICDDVDNCPPGGAVSTANPAQTDTDGDGRGDICDNCSLIQNGPTVFAAGLMVSQCDRDSDGYGNACDGDLNQDGFVTALDNPIYTTALGLFFPPPPGQTDMNCDGFMTAIDNPWYTAQIPLFFPGPSGFSCAGTTTGVCPSIP